MSGHDCLFCAEVSGREPARIEAWTATGYLRRDNFAAAPGHMQAVPRRHVVSYFDLSDAELLDIAVLLRQARDLAPADGYTIGVNEGRAAGRTVDHLHVHLIPRRVGDHPDPRGGIRAVLPDAPSPATWA